MNGLYKTRHIEKRKRQRGISDECIKVVLEFGKKERTRDNCYSYSMTQQTYDLAQKKLGDDFRRVRDKVRRIYVVVGAGGSIVTAAYRNNHSRRGKRSH